MSITDKELEQVIEKASKFLKKVSVEHNFRNSELGKVLTEEGERVITEIWKEVPGFEGLYEVSNAGKVRSVPSRVKVRSGKTRKKQSKELKTETVRGYKRVALFKSSKRTWVYIKSLVESVFSPSEVFFE